MELLQRMKDEGRDLRTPSQSNIGALRRLFKQALAQKRLVLIDNTYRLCALDRFMLSQIVIDGMTTFNFQNGDVPATVPGKEFPWPEILT
ncbi:hypothetical protein [Jannaschia sp. M317]|uniref:hypothetical protein n=1 Tax=Jannaschia sp. M317 TaxID=2867011 RepID=UPI0021A81FFA|nr:hypothetical protein [Jannaschia sp. M317]UWQ18917.1 hypothetical protein K3551_06445 [Jannaschia sp. M317]